MSELLPVDNLGTMVRAEIDIQISTAKAYPRDLKTCFAEAMSTACFSQEIAESCMYALPRDGKTITGASIRLAEIFVSAWGNLHCSVETVKNDGRFISVRAMVIDRQKNVIYAETVERSIMTSAKKGTPRTYTNDMQQTTAAAAASIALRKAIFRIIPKQFIEVVYEAAKKVACGDTKSISEVRTKAISAFEKSGINKQQIFDYFDIKAIEDITSDHIEQLIGIRNAIKEGTLSKEHAFDRTYNSDTGELLVNKADEVNQKLIGEVEPETLPDYTG